MDKGSLTVWVYRRYTTAHLALTILKQNSQPTAIESNSGKQGRWLRTVCYSFFSSEIELMSFVVPLTQGQLEEV